MIECGDKPHEPFVLQPENTVDFFLFIHGKQCRRSIHELAFVSVDCCHIFVFYFIFIFVSSFFLVFIWISRPFVHVIAHKMTFYWNIHWMQSSIHMTTMTLLRLTLTICCFAIVFHCKVFFLLRSSWSLFVPKLTKFEIRLVSTEMASQSFSNKKFFISSDKKMNEKKNPTRIPISLMVCLRQRSDELDKHFVLHSLELHLFFNFSSIFIDLTQAKKKNTANYARRDTRWKEKIIKFACEIYVAMLGISIAHSVRSSALCVPVRISMFSI